MAVQDALAFLAAVRDRPDLQEELAAGAPEATYDALEALAVRLGHPCGAADLQAAFRHDWVMRWLHHTEPGPDATSPAR